MAKKIIDPEVQAAKLAEQRKKNRERVARRRAANPGGEREYKKRYREKHKKEIAAKAAAKHAANREKANATSKAYYDKNREALVEKARVRRAANLEGTRMRLRDWHIANRERRLAAQRIRAARPENKAKMKIYALRNRPRWRVYTATRRARLLNAPGFFTEFDIQRMYKAQRGKCAYCPTSLKKGFHVDHIISVSRGGTNWPRNLQLLCGPCNLKKNAMDPVIFAHRIGLLI